MSTSADTQPATRKFARVLGPYMVLLPGAVALNFNTWMKALFQAFTGDPMWQWFYGALLTFIGIFVIANHRSWRGLAASIVSFFGYVALLRGVTILYFTRAYIETGNKLEQGGSGSTITRLFFVLLAIGGLYLTYFGWVAKPVRDKATSVTPSVTAQNSSTG